MIPVINNDITPTTKTKISDIAAGDALFGSTHRVFGPVILVTVSELSLSGAVYYPLSHLTQGLSPGTVLVRSPLQISQV